MLKAFITVLSIAWFLTACQSTPSTTTADHSNVSGATSDTTTVLVRLDNTNDQPDLPPSDLWSRIGSELSWQDINNARVTKARKRYLQQHNYLGMVSQRASLYLHFIVEEVGRRGLPMEIALLPLVESTLDPFSSSPARAAGLWQIMPATGRHLGLQQDWWYDGRRDVRDSTRAALDYLEELHSRLGDDWMLALAAYNSGKARVTRARKSNKRKGLSTDYWSLRLPKETRHYVPRLIALAQIISSPDTYGVVIPKVANAPAFEVAQTGGQIEMARAAQLAGIDMPTLRALNPGQLRWATSPDMPSELLLPVGKAATFTSGVAALTTADRVRWQHYKIKSGDNLGSIAKKFNTKVGLLREVNNIRGSLIRAGKTLMIPIGSAWASSLAMADAAKSGATKRHGYRVRRGDSLYEIAARFSVSINDIVAWNSLDPSTYLQPGQKLTLYLRGG